MRWRFAGAVNTSAVDAYNLLDTIGRTPATIKPISPCRVSIEASNENHRLTCVFRSIDGIKHPGQDSGQNSGKRSGKDLKIEKISRNLAISLLD